MSRRHKASRPFPAADFGCLAGPPDIPPFGLFADGFFVDLQRAAQVFALLFGGGEGIVNPPQSVGGDFPLRFFHRGDRFGISRQRHGDAKDGNGQAANLEHSAQPPKTGAGAVFIDGLHVHMPDAGKRLRADDFREKRLRSGIAVKNAVFAAFLIVDDKLHGDFGAAGPPRARRVFAVTNEVAGIGRVGGRGRVHPRIILQGGGKGNSCPSHANQRFYS